MGIGAVAFAALLADDVSATDAAGINPLARREPHFAPRASRVIHIVLDGGMSHIDTFDPKPKLTELAGRSLGEEHGNRSAFASPFKFNRCGKSGLEISEVFPRLSQHADELCVLRGMHTTTPDHEGAMLTLNTGDMRLPRPSLGSWSLYGLGTENQNLPGFIALSSGVEPFKVGNWQSAFLPAIYQGQMINVELQRVEEMLPDIRSPHAGAETQKRQLALLRQLNERHRRGREEDARLEARLRSFELAFGMQRDAAEAFDVSREPESVRELYGEKGSSRSLLIARRLVERGVRFVQVWAGGWDHHADLPEGLRGEADGIDQPVSALLTDLARLGLLKDTLILLAGEFGRTPASDPNGTVSNPGRDHNADAFSVVLAGGGVRGGMAFGATDELGGKAVENRMHVHDLHATILHLLGFDHEKLTYRYAGRDFRLTDVAGKVATEIIA
jgi:hypothetical protein